MMQQQIKEQFWAYIVENNPELMFRLQEAYSVRKFLNDQVGSIMPHVLGMKAEGSTEASIMESVMQQLTATLRPSRYQFLKEMMVAHFPDAANVLVERGTLTYELINIMERSAAVFHAWGFCEETSDCPQGYARVLEVLHDYVTGMKLLRQG